MDIFATIFEIVDQLSPLHWKGLISLIILFLLWMIKRVANRSIKKAHTDIATRYTWHKTLSYTIYLLAMISLALIWSNHFGDIATFLGLLSAGLAIAFQEPIVNIAGWYYILVQKPFKVGDRIEVEGQIGDVIGINLFQFTINEVGNWVSDDQSTGRIIHIPNLKVFKTFIANYHAGLEFIWNEIAVMVTFESDWKKAKTQLQLILDHHAPKVTEEVKKNLEEASGQYMIYFNKTTPIVYTTVADSGVVLTMRYLCEPKKRRSTTCEIWEQVLELFAANKDLDFAYPTRRAVALEGFHRTVVND